LRAIECDRPFGHAAEPWISFGILSNLERASGNLQAAAKARAQALEAYVAYRRDGGESMLSGAQLCALLEQALRQNKLEEIRSEFEQFAGAPGQPAYVNSLFLALFAILNGSRDPALAEDPNLYYADAAELMLLLERLG
jgi:HPt (histidine-containing phosphotransfer) domain-containing protein